MKFLPRCFQVMLLGVAFACAAEDLPAVLTEGTTQLGPETDWQIKTHTGMATVISYERPSVSAGKIFQARTTEVHLKEAWKPLIIARSSGSYSAGDVLLITARVRCTETTNAAGTGLLRTHFERILPSDKKSFSAEFRVPKEWTRVWLPFVLNRDIPPTNGALTFNLGHEVQMVEVCDMQLYCFPKGFDRTRLPKSEYRQFAP